MIKNNFRILKKPQANLQTIAKAPVKFQKDWPKTVGGVEGTRYLLKIRNHALRTTHYGKPKTMSLRFSSKRRGTTKTNYFLLCLCCMFSLPNDYTIHWQTTQQVIILYFYSSYTFSFILKLFIYISIFIRLLPHLS